VLEITDGTSRRELQLDTRQLRTGGVAYSPATQDVSFRLELVGADGNVSESLRVVEGGAQPAAPVAGAEPPVASRDLKPVEPPLAAPVRTAATQRPHKPRAVKPPAAKPAAHRTTPRAAWFDDGL
jgi:hypothetical protein